MTKGSFINGFRVFYLLNYFPSIPNDLRIALINNLEVTEDNSQMTNEYIKVIKNLVNIKSLRKEDYFKIFQILLFVEHFERSKMSTLKGCKLKKNSDNIFTLFAPTLTGDNPLVKPKNTIELKETVLNDLNNYSYYCKVTKISKKNVDFIIKHEEDRFLQSYNKNKRYDINLIDSDWPMKLCHYALEKAKNYNFTSLIYPTIGIHKNYENLELSWFNQSMLNNLEQKQAVINILNKTARPAAYILFGPPGTGKTATLVEFLCQAWQKGLNVLVCALSNEAVDEIVKRLLKYIPSNDIYRIYSRSYKMKKGDSTILPCTNFSYDSKYFLSSNSVLSIRIVFVTIISCARLLTAIKHFSYIIIDEASQATEPETIIPLLLGSNAQVVLAGDPYQLGPIVQSRIAKPLLGISMLERLMDCSIYKKKKNNYDPHYVMKLKRNYRSHECILHVSNKEFYENELIACGDTKIINRAIGWSKLPNKTFPIIFHASDGMEISEKYSYSVYNRKEIFIIMEYLELLMDTKLGNLKITQDHIGIVSPFKQQKIEINKQLKKKNWERIDVGTVETFQGREKEIIILTTVRSRLFVHNGIQDIGFLSDEKRFNVAITRAKCLLIVIGNPMVLETNKHWKVLVEYCKENKAYIESSSTLNQAFVKKKDIE